MVVCLTTGASMLIALAIGMVCFSAVALKRGFPLEDVLRMILSSTRRSFIVLRVLLLIGLVTALWRTSGTIAFFVYYGVQLITPHFLCSLPLSFRPCSPMPWAPVSVWPERLA